MGDTRAQADLLSVDDSVPDLVDLVEDAPTGRTPLVIDTPSNLKAVSASPQPANGCTSSGPPVVAGLDVNAVLREPDPPSCLWEQWGPSAWLPPSFLTPARAPPSSAQGVTPVPFFAWGFAAQALYPPQARGAKVSLVIWLCPNGRTRMNQ